MNLLLLPAGFFALCGWAYTDKKENKIFLIYKEIHMGSGTKSYMRKDFLIYEEMHKYFYFIWGRYSHILLCTRSLWISLIYEENFILFFYQCIRWDVCAGSPRCTTGTSCRRRMSSSGSLSRRRLTPSSKLPTRYSPNMNHD